MRQITQSDAPKLAQLIRATGLDDNPDPERIARVSLESNHVTLIETAADGELIGFVDAFSTVAQDGTSRWEVDLLGVHPNYWGKGIARSLVREVAKVGRETGMTQARALVKISNDASAMAFQRCGFTPFGSLCDLVVSDAPVSDQLSAPADAHLISVATLTYSGLWVEGNQSSEALRCAQSVRVRYGWDVAGAVIPEDDYIEGAGYQSAGKYRWLTLTL